MESYSVQLGEKQTMQLLLSGGYVFVKLQPSCDHHHAPRLQHIEETADRPRILEGVLKDTQIAQPSGGELLFWLQGCEEPVQVSLERFMLSTHGISVDAGVHPPIAHLMGSSEGSSQLERYTRGLSNSISVNASLGSDALYPPLTPSLRAGADPQYLRFYETSLQGTSMRPLPGQDPFILSESETVQTATMEKILTTCKIKIYFPSDGPVAKKPTGIFFHGGKKSPVIPLASETVLTFTHFRRMAER